VQYNHHLLSQLSYSLKTHILEEAKDTWTYILGNYVYTAARFYHLPFQNVHPSKPFIWIWDSSCVNKIIVFARLLMMDRLNVRNILRRKKHKLHGNDYICVLCSAHCEEMMFYLFFTCSFSLAYWSHLGIHLRFDLNFHTMMGEAKSHFNNFFMEVFIIRAWLIWKQRMTSSSIEAGLSSAHGSWGSSRRPVYRLAE
jgi:hypothetical protein